MKSLFPAVSLLFLAAAAASAQRYEISVGGGISRPSQAILGSLDPVEPRDDDSRLRRSPGTGFALRLTLNTPGYYGHEIGAGRSHATFETKIHNEDDTVTPVEDKVFIDQLFYNFMIYFMPAGERWRPFITGGLQLFRYGAPNVPDWPGGTSRKYGANYGGGIKLMPFRHFLIRLDVRDYIGGKPYDLSFQDITRAGGVFRHFEASAGFSIAF